MGLSFIQYPKDIITTVTVPEGMSPVNAYAALRSFVFRGSNFEEIPINATAKKLAKLIKIKNGSPFYFINQDYRREIDLKADLSNFPEIKVCLCKDSSQEVQTAEKLRETIQKTLKQYNKRFTLSKLDKNDHYYNILNENTEIKDTASVGCWKIFKQLIPQNVKEDSVKISTLPTTSSVSGKDVFLQFLQSDYVESILEHLDVRKKWMIHDLREKGMSDEEIVYELFRNNLFRKPSDSFLNQSLSKASIPFQEALVKALASELPMIDKLKILLGKHPVLKLGPIKSQGEQSEILRDILCQTPIRQCDWEEMVSSLEELKSINRLLSWKNNLIPYHDNKDIDPILEGIRLKYPDQKTLLNEMFKLLERIFELAELYDNETYDFFHMEPIIIKAIKELSKDFPDHLLLDYLETISEKHHHLLHMILECQLLYNLDFPFGKSEIAKSKISKEYLGNSIYLLAAMDHPKMDKWLPESLRTKQMYRSIMQYRPDIFENIPQKLKTYDMYLLAVEKFDYPIAKVPEEHRTYPMLLAKAKRKPMFFDRYNNRRSYLSEIAVNFKELDLPKDCQTYELYFEFVKNHGLALKDVPKELITYEMCLAAVKSHPSPAVESDPFHRREYLDMTSIYRDLINGSEVSEQIALMDRCSNILRRIPERYRTEELYLAAVKNFPLNLLFVPEDKKTAEMHIAAVKKAPPILALLPRKWRTDELCSMVFERSHQNFEFIPEENRTDEMYIARAKDGCSGYLKTIPEEKITDQVKVYAEMKTNSYPGFFRTLPEEKKTEKLCSMVWEMKPLENFKFFPEKFKTPEHYLRALRQWDYKIEDIPERARTYEVCVEMVKKDPSFLKSIPKELQIEKFYAEAFKNSPRIFKFLPEEFKTKKRCLEALRYRDCEIEDIPERARTYEVWLKMVEKDPSLLKSIPKELQIEKFYAEAFEHSSRIFKFLPEEFKTPERCLEALRYRDCEIEDIPERARTYEVWLKMVEKDPSLLKSIPKELQIEKFYAEAFEHSSRVFEFLPEEFKTKERCLKALRSWGCQIEDIPERARTYEVCLEMVRQDPSFLKSIPKEFQIEKFYAKAFEHSSRVFKFLPEEFKTPERCLKALRSWDCKIEDIPEGARTYDVYFEMIEQDPSFLKRIPEKMKIEEMYEVAFKYASMISKLLPETFKTPELYPKVLKFWREDISAEKTYFFLDSSNIKAFKGHVVLKKETLPVMLRSSLFYPMALNLWFKGYKYFMGYRLGSDGGLDVAKDLHKKNPRVLHDIYLEQVKEDPFILECIPEDIRTEEIYSAVFEYISEIFKFLPKEFKIRERYLIMLGWGVDIEDIPEEIRTNQFYVDAFNQGMNQVFKFLPEELKTPEQYARFLKCQDSFTIESIPEEKRTYDVYLEMVRKDPSFLKHVPKEMKTHQFCIEAFDDDITSSRVFKFLPKKVQTEEVCLAAMKKDLKNFEFIPSDLKTAQMYATAVREGVDDTFIEKIPNNLKGNRMVQDSVAEAYLRSYFDTRYDQRPVLADQGPFKRGSLNRYFL